MENESNISLGGTSVRVRKCHFAHFDRKLFLYSTVMLHCTKRAQNNKWLMLVSSLFTCWRAIILGYSYSNSNISITYFRWKSLALTGIWTSDLLEYQADVLPIELSRLAFETSCIMTSQPSILAECRDRRSPNFQYWLHKVLLQKLNIKCKVKNMKNFILVY